MYSSEYLHWKQWENQRALSEFTGTWIKCGFRFCFIVLKRDLHAKVILSSFVFIFMLFLHSFCFFFTVFLPNIFFSFAHFCCTSSVYSLVPSFINLLFSPPFGVFISVCHCEMYGRHLHSSHMLPLLPTFCTNECDKSLERGGCLCMLHTYCERKRNRQASLMVFVFNWTTMVNTSMHL